MAGFFGSISTTPCAADVFYGTDYHSHLGTRRGGMATFDKETGHFNRVIHSISQASFRTKMENELPKFIGNAGIGISGFDEACNSIIEGENMENALTEAREKSAAATYTALKAE